MNKLPILVTLFFFSFGKTYAKDGPLSALKKSDQQFFIENRGQWDAEVLFLTQVGGIDVWITRTGVQFDFYQLEPVIDDFEPKAQRESFPLLGKFDKEHLNQMRTGHRILMKMKGSNERAYAEGKQKQKGYYNYFIGNDASKYACNVGLFKEAIVKELYSGIDIRYYFDSGAIRYDYIIHAGADPSLVRFELQGTDSIYVNKETNLFFTTCFGEMALAELRTYQEYKAEIVSRFVKNGNDWSIEVGDYDKASTLIIDPLIYSTYLGGSAEDFGHGVVVDNIGNSYVTGFTMSVNYFATPGAYQVLNYGIQECFVTKLNPSGTGLVYSTYVGGSDADYAISIDIDSAYNVYLTGQTLSTNFPTTFGSYQTSHAGNNDVFVTKLNSTGSALIYSTYIGGGGGDFGLAIAIDDAGHAFIAGVSSSGIYDITIGAYQQAYGGGLYDNFVSKLNAGGTGLMYSTYIGGSGKEICRSLVIDKEGYAYITGEVESNNYDTTVGAYQAIYGGGNSDVFVTKLNQTGSSLVYSTYLGGIGDDFGYSIAIDSFKNAYITGYTSSINFDTTVGAYQTWLEGNTDAFISKLDSSGTVLIYSTLLGGANEDYGSAVQINGSGNAIVTGYTGSPDFDTTAGAYQCFLGGQRDVFISQLNANGSSLVYSTYLGGIGYDRSFACAVDSLGIAYITGWTSSIDYDVTALAFQPLNGGIPGDTDAFVTKIELTPCLIYSSASVNTPICEGETLILSVTPAAGATYYWSGPNGFTSALQNPSIANVSMAANGVYTITVTSANGCTSSDTINVIINPLPTVVANNDTTLCEGQTLDLTVTPTAGATYNWIGPNGFISASQNPSIANVTMAANGDYTVDVVDSNGCSKSDTTNVKILVCTGIAESMQDNTILIFPNPNHGTFTLQTSKLGNYELLDVAGRIINTYEVKSSPYIITEKLSSGMYFIREKDSGASIRNRVAQKVMIE